MSIKQTKSKARFVGVLEEKGLELVKGEIKGREGNKIPCEIIKGKLSVATDNGLFTLRVYTASKTTKNEDNKMFKGIKTILDEYKDRKTYGDEADVIDCDVQININDYVTDGANAVKTTTQISLNSAKRVTGEVESTTDIDMVGYIGKIVPEINKDDEETGRLIVDFATIGYGDRALPFKLFVGEDMADDFTDYYEVGQTVELYISATQRHVGETKPKTAKFGRAANVVSGFDVLELIIVGGEEAFEDEYDGEGEEIEGTNVAISKKTIKELMKAREMFLENLLNEKKSGKTKEKKGGMGSRKPVVEEDDKAPWDEDDVDDLF